jgi:alpha-tubulin suppressor-like RCC1 family protein
MDAMKLYALGHNGSTQLQSSPFNEAYRDTTKPYILQAKAIRVLWSSWCDVVIGLQDDTNVWTIDYRGIGLTSVQKAHIANSGAIKRAVGGFGGTVDFFGTDTHDGLRGYVIYTAEGMNSDVVIISTDAEEEIGISAIQSYSITGDWKVVAIRIESGGGVLVSTVSKVAGGEQILYFEDLGTLRKQLDQGSISSSSGQTIASFSPIQWCMNSTTATALGPYGKVHTATNDPRYSKCLGRPSTNTAKFVLMPYFSETCIMKIASGGYMSAAVSTEGELFLWGHANPGINRELSVLKDKPVKSAMKKETVLIGISTDDEQDEMVKCLNVIIEGKEANVYDVAIGCGHVIVAVELHVTGMSTKRAVLGAGINNKGQLAFGPRAEFVEDFEEITELRNKKIEQLVATAWTTFVVLTEG